MPERSEDVETPSKPSVRQRIIRHFRRTLIAGLLLLVPVVITYLVLRLLFNFVDGVLQPGIERVLGSEIPGLGIVLLATLVYLVGLLGANFIGKRLIRLVQATLLRIPIVNAVYSASKQLIESFSGSGTTGFKRVVAIEYPRVGAWTIGFLTGMTTDENGRSMGIIYIPTAPTPQSGWVAILPTDQIYDTDLSVPIAMRLVLSGGIVAPPQIRKRAMVI